MEAHRARLIAEQSADPLPLNGSRRTPKYFGLQPAASTSTDGPLDQPHPRPKTSKNKPRSGTSTPRAVDGPTLLPSLHAAPLSTTSWTADSLLHSGPNFQPIPRVSAFSPGLSDAIATHLERGMPLVIEGWHEHPKWPKEIFDLKYLLEEFGDNRKHSLSNFDCILFDTDFCTSTSYHRSRRCPSG